MFLFDETYYEPVRATQSLAMRDLFYFLPFGYLFTILIETPVLILGLPKPVTLKQRVLCGIWLTACTYPIVILVLPAIFYGGSRAVYLFVAEVFAPVAECILFWLAFRKRLDLTTLRWIQAFTAITLANLASFGLGEVVNYYGWFGLF
jgi:hypothetical protein